MIHISNDVQQRQALADRLRTVGCDVNTDQKTDWLSAGDFDAAIQTPDDDSGKTGPATTTVVAAGTDEAPAREEGTGAS